MRTLLFVITAVGIGVASLAVVPRVEPVSMATCIDEFGQGVRSSVSLAVDRKITDRRLGAAVRPLCRELVRLERARVHEETVMPSFRAFVARRPQAWMPLCRTLTTAQLAAEAHLLRFVTSAERRRFRRAHCKLAARHLTATSIGIAWPRVAAKHPALYAPLCASMFQHHAGREALASHSRSEMQLISRRTCREALRTGAIIYGSKGLVNARVNEGALTKIFARQSRRASRA